MSPDTQESTCFLGWSLVVTPLSLGMPGGYAVWQVPCGSMPELIGFSLFALLMVRFPRLCPGVLRHRTLVDMWVARTHLLHPWLKSGVFYLVELGHMSRELCVSFIILGRLKDEIENKVSQEAKACQKRVLDTLLKSKMGRIDQVPGETRLTDQLT